MHEQSYGEAQAKTKFTSRYTSRACDAGLLHFRRLRCIEILYIEGTSGPWAYPSSRQRENTSRTDPLCPIAHAACPARQRRMVQFIGSLTLEPAGYHGRAHLQRRLYLVPSMYNISMLRCRREERGAAAWSYIYIYMWGYPSVARVLHSFHSRPEYDRSPSPYKSPFPQARADLTNRRFLASWQAHVSRKLLHFIYSSLNPLLRSIPLRNKTSTHRYIVQLPVNIM